MNSRKHQRARGLKSNKFMQFDSEGNMSMDMNPHSWGLVVAGVAGVAGAAITSRTARRGQDAAAADAAISEERMLRAEERLNAQLQNLAALTPPNLQQYIVPYQQAVLQGEITPEEAVARLAQDTKMAGITVPPELLSAQSRALTSLQRVADEGGLTAIDRARLFDAKQEMATASRGAQEAIVQNAQQRGIAGSGIEQANRLLAQQAAATRGAQAGVDVAAEAQRRALQAMVQSGELAGQQRTQTVNEQARVAEAQDAINRFNTELTNRTQAANVAARNDAQAANLRERQRLSEFNIGQREREAAARLGAVQDTWQNTMNLATARTNAAAGQATNAMNANNTAQQTAANARTAAAGQQAAAIQQGASAIGRLADAWNKKDGED